MLGRQCQRLETLFRKWPPKFPLALRRRRSEACANLCVANDPVAEALEPPIRTDLFVELFDPDLWVLGSHMSHFEIA
jgi:hypothetical protein